MTIRGSRQSSTILVMPVSAVPVIADQTSPVFSSVSPSVSAYSPKPIRIATRITDTPITRRSTITRDPVGRAAAGSATATSVRPTPGVGRVTGAVRLQRRHLRYVGPGRSAPSPHESR